MNWELFGLAAGAITVSGFFPQIIKGYMTKKMDDLSYFFNILIGVGMLMWIIYGIKINSLAVIATNIVGVSCNLIMILMKYKYSKRNQKHK
ncbi:MAG: SemiSWEET family transporter [archaeon]